jgi:hypothetical protein
VEQRGEGGCIRIRIVKVINRNRDDRKVSRDYDSQNEPGN